MIQLRTVLFSSSYSPSFSSRYFVLYLLPVYFSIQAFKPIRLFLFPLLSPLQMFRAFGNRPPCAPIALTPTTLVLTSANIVDFKPLRLRLRLVPPEFPSICPPSIVESPLFSQSELPNHMKSRSVDCSWNWSPFYPPFRAPRPLPPPPQETSLDFSCGKILRGKPRFTYLAVLTSALILNRNVAALPDWPLVQLIAQLGNCVPFLIPLAD